MDRRHLWLQRLPLQDATAQERQELVANLVSLRRLLLAGEKPPERLLFPACRVDEATARQAAEVAELYLDKGGAGISYRLPTLLKLVAGHPTEALLPFWERITPPRKVARRQDTTAEERAWIAMETLLAMGRRGSRAALDVWLRLWPGLRPLERATLLEATLSRLPSPQIESFLARVRRQATEDTAFEARYGARKLLARRGEPIAPEHPAGDIAFELKCYRFSCSLRLRSTDTFFALHEAIQRALKWDNDHLWCFFIGKTTDQGTLRWPGEHVHGCEELVLSDGDAQARPARPGEFAPERLGELGLRVGDTLLYTFDFGDNHLFELRAVALRERADRGNTYPQISPKKGTPPRQYDTDPDE